MESAQAAGFYSLAKNIGTFHLGQKQVLIPEMCRAASHLTAAAFRSFGIRARVLKTYQGLELGREFTSGKECYPCQVTMGDILSFVQEEKKRLGRDFRPENYAYFMPESDGPCRFGMYNKYQRFVLDSFPGLNKLKQIPHTRIKTELKRLLSCGADLLYKKFRQRHVYRQAFSLLDLAEDHKISHLEQILMEEDVFSFDIDTEAGLSIAGMLAYASHGYSGVVNVYPFTCMPGMTTSAIAKPLMAKLGVPYLDAPYDASIQPGREAAIRTFMYQAAQH